MTSPRVERDRRCASLLRVSAVAEQLRVPVHEVMNAGTLRCVLFGSMRAREAGSLSQSGVEEAKHEPDRPPQKRKKRKEPYSFLTPARGQPVDDPSGSKRSGYPAGTPPPGDPCPQ
jgi:hypothetical protein